MGTQVSSLVSYSYTLGAAGNRTAVTELSGRTVNYTYDDLYRLTSESITNDPHSVNGSAVLRGFTEILRPMGIAPGPP
jgi:YD repeat-containing protein